MVGEIQYRDSEINSWNTGWIQDFSYGGVRICASKPVSVGQVVDLQVTLPIHNDVTDLEGRAIWIRPRKGSNELFDIGVCFSKHSAYQVQVVDAAANEMVALALRSANELSVNHALSINDLQSSLALAYKEHEPDWDGTGEDWARYCNKWIFNNHSDTFLLKSHEQAFGTTTLVQDSEFGLPSDRIFPGELLSLRSAERRLAEVSLLALDTELLTERFAKTELGHLAAFIRLFKIAFDKACTNDITDLIIAASPKYQNIFSYLLFKPLTDPYELGYTHSLIPLHLDIQRAKEEQKNMPSEVLAYLYELHSRLPALFT
jgi:Tfp pilus assembly protein PilZ